MITYLGSYSVGGLIPTMIGLLGAIIPRLRGQLAGAMRINGQLSFRLPSLDARIAAVARVAAALALQPPGVRFNVAANFDLIAVLQAQLAIYTDLLAAFGEVGVEAFSYDGTQLAAPSEIGGALATHGFLPGEHMNALIFATRYPATFAAMAKVFVA